MWRQDYDKIYELLKNAYYKSDEYFGSICRPITKAFQLYDIYGIDTINDVICGNTILCQYYSPFFSFTTAVVNFLIWMVFLAGYIS